MRKVSNISCRCRVFRAPCNGERKKKKRTYGIRRNVPPQPVAEPAASVIDPSRKKKCHHSKDLSACLFVCLFWRVVAVVFTQMAVNVRFSTSNTNNREERTYIYIYMSLFM